MTSLRGTLASLLLPLLVLPGCSSEAEAVADQEAALFASVPDCRVFDLDQLVAQTHDLSPDYQCAVSTTLQRSSQPDERWIKSLSDPTIREHPFRSVVNLRGENGSNSEEPIVQRYGMKPLNIRVRDMHAPTREQIVQFLTFVTDEANQPALVHCKAGQGRTGTFVAAYRMAVEGWSKDDALAEARRFRVNDEQLAFLGELAQHLGDADLAAFRMR